MTIKEAGLDLLYLLSLPQEEHGDFFPVDVPFPAEIAQENEFVVKSILDGISSDVDEYRTLAVVFTELIAIDALFAIPGRDVDFWARSPVEWRWLWEIVREIAKRGAERNKVTTRDVVFARDVRVIGKI